MRRLSISLVLATSSLLSLAPAHATVHVGPHDAALPLERRPGPPPRVTPLRVVGSPATNGPPRIMYWYGKVNQHVDLETMRWESDPDGVSGANLDPLEYCQKWYPTTVDVRPYGYVSLSTWRERGNVNRHTAKKLSLECVQADDDDAPQLAT